MQELVEHSEEGTGSDHCLGVCSVSGFAVRAAQTTGSVGTGYRGQSRSEYGSRENGVFSEGVGDPVI
jgi:hypothetical protein